MSLKSWAVWYLDGLCGKKYAEGAVGRKTYGRIIKKSIIKNIISIVWMLLNQHNIRKNKKLKSIGENADIWNKWLILKFEPCPWPPNKLRLLSGSFYFENQASTRLGSCYLVGAQYVCVHPHKDRETSVVYVCVWLHVSLCVSVSLLVCMCACRCVSMCMCVRRVDLNCELRIRIWRFLPL